MAVGSIVAEKRKKITLSWLLDAGVKALFPLAMVLAGVLIAHEASINSHAGRITALERAQEQQRVVHERILDTLTEIQVALGRLEERITALQRPR